MPFFQERPTLVEAVNLSIHQGDEIPPWYHAAIEDGRLKRNDDGSFLVDTPFGLFEADAGDWLVKMSGGGIYPYKPDVFNASYKPFPDPNKPQTKK